MRLCFFISLGLVLGLSMSGCGGGGPTITRLDPNTQVDLSGNWNASDSRQVANTMIADSMTKPWHDNFREEHGRDPRVQVDAVIVRGTGDVIDTGIFINDIVREFVNSGKIEAYNAIEERQRIQRIREQLHEQTLNDPNDSRLRDQQEIAPDYILGGTIRVQDDQAGRVRQRYYAVNLELVDATTQRKVWMGNETISKLVERRR